MGGRLGYTSRNELMGLLFGDVLPLKTTSRASKVAFNAAYTGEQTKQFARDWDGSGLDDRLVDPEALRAEWLAESPSGLSFGLLHAAWLARQGVSPTPLDVAS